MDVPDSLATLLSEWLYVKVNIYLAVTHIESWVPKPKHPALQRREWNVSVFPVRHYIEQHNVTKKLNHEKSQTPEDE